MLAKAWGKGLGPIHYIQSSSTVLAHRNVSAFEERLGQLELILADQVQLKLDLEGTTTIKHLHLQSGS